MSTSTADPGTTMTRPRVWLVGGGRTPDPDPADLPIVRDDLMHIWRPGPDGQMHMTVDAVDAVDGTNSGHDHHATWRELRARHDLVEVA